MKNQQPAPGTRLYSPRATLCSIGIKLRSLKLFETIAEHVHIRQKTVKYTPVEKLTDAPARDFVNLPRPERSETPENYYTGLPRTNARDRARVAS